MTIDCFKELCMQANTEQAKKVRKYYIKLEKIIMKIVHQQSVDYANLLTQKEQEIEDLQDMVDNNISKHEQDLINLAKDKRVLYLGIVEEIITMIGVTKHIETRVKFGITKGIDRRVLIEHKKDFDTFTLKYVFITEFNSQLEDLIKEKCKDKNHILYNRRISKKYKIKNQTELIQLDDKFTLDHLVEVITKLKENCDQEDIDKKDKEYRLMKKRLALRGELDDVLGNKEAASIDADYIKYKELEKKYNELKNKIKNNEEVILSDDEEEIVIDEHKGHSFCSGCKDWHQIEEFAENKKTHKLYTECIKRKEQKLKDRELVEESNKKFLENQKRALKYQELYQQLIEETDPFKCYQCSHTKEAVEFGINEANQEIYRICEECRLSNYEKLHGKQKENEEILELVEGVTFKCTIPTCGKICLIEFDPVHQRNYSTCIICREKDSANRERNAKEYEEFLKNPELNVACIVCNVIFKTEKNKHKDGFYKKCPVHRLKATKQNTEAYERNKDQKLAHKKEHYEENKEEIRAKQKAYYDANRDKILEQKRKKNKLLF